VSGHAPSAGVIYPTLQMLEDQGCVAMNEEDNKKVYILTDAGRRFLDEHRDTVKLLSSRAAQPRWSSLPGVGRRIAELPARSFPTTRTLMTRRYSRSSTYLNVAKKQIGEVIFAEKALRRRAAMEAASKKVHKSACIVPHVDCFFEAAYKHDKIIAFITN